MKKAILIILSSGFVTGCATLEPEGENVRIVANVDADCKNLGPVSVTITGWGLPEESLNVLRNNAGGKGANTLVQTGGATGIAYYCSENSKAN